MDAVRARLEQLIEERGSSYAGISALLGRNPAYVQQFIRRGVPRRLKEEDRSILAQYFGVSEEELGKSGGCSRVGQLEAVSVIAVGASAGHGARVEEERKNSSIRFSGTWLRKMGLRPDRISIIQVKGESMAPTLIDGDEIMVNHDDAEIRLRDGIYVLLLDGVLFVKRVALGPRKGQFTVRSDNPAYPQWDNLEPELMKIVGRVVWVGRKLEDRF
ncbi:S24 family peptidase [Sphingobium sp. 15-1]|uniref:S24 family peptidase n=1 Tax=Sphingobium TaxID=165695 RepID=UPI00351052D2